MDTDKLLLLTLEIEGALRVIKHADSTEARTLLAMKVKQLNDIVNPTVAPETEIVPEFVAVTPPPMPQPVPEPIPEPEIEIKEEILPPPITQPENIAEPTHAAKPEPQIEVQLDEPPVMQEEYVEDTVIVIDEPQQIYEPEQALVEMDDVVEEYIEPSLIAPASQPAKVNESLIKAFTINDRYRFTCELFGTDSDDFYETVKLLAAMPNMTEVESYLFEDLMWDSENPAVKEFIAIVEQHIPA